MRIPRARRARDLSCARRPARASRVRPSSRVRVGSSSPPLLRVASIGLPADVIVDGQSRGRSELGRGGVGARFTARRARRRRRTRTVARTPGRTHARRIRTHRGESHRIASHRARARCRAENPSTTSSPSRWRCPSGLRFTSLRCARPATRRSFARRARRASPVLGDGGAVARGRDRASRAIAPEPRVERIPAVPTLFRLNPILTLLARTPREILPSRSTRRTWTPRGDRRRRSCTRSGRSNRSRRTS